MFEVVRRSHTSWRMTPEGQPGEAEVVGTGRQYADSEAYWAFVEAEARNAVDVPAGSTPVWGIEKDGQPVEFEDIPEIDERDVYECIVDDLGVPEDEAASLMGYGT